MFHRWVYSNVDRIITISENMKQHHMDFTAVQKEKLETIYSGVSLDGFDVDRYNKRDIQQ